MQVVREVFLVNGFPYGNHQNSYVVRRTDTAAMVDSGDLEDPTFEQVRKNCRRWGIEAAELTYLLLTHAHFDHASHAAALQRLGVPVACNAECAEAISLGDDRCIGYAVQRQFKPCTADRVLNDGEEFQLDPFTFRCIAAPGHAESCMVYELTLNGECIWFCGDLFEVGPECRSVNLCWNGGPDYDAGQYVETLRRLSRMRCDILCPGHGPPLVGNGIRLVQMAYRLAMEQLR